MLQIKDTLVSLDLIERRFVCDLESCLGACCIEGDAGAPLTDEEFEALNEHKEEILPLLSPRARKVVEQDGVGYFDPDGDLVTSLLDGAACAFSTFSEGGMCLCALEKGWREGKLPDLKPMSCRLYPARLKEYEGFTAVNLHRWKICRCAEVLGRKTGTRAYEFLEGPLTRRFGKEWYDELKFTAEEYLRQHPEL